MPRDSPLKYHVNNRKKRREIGRMSMTACAPGVMARVRGSISFRFTSSRTNTRTGYALHVRKCICLDAILPKGKAQPQTGL